MYHFLFDLMKKFELCFSFPDDDGNYLIPELLDKQEPETVRAFRPAECLNFQYHYPILPEGLLPRFIVRTHVLSEAARGWRGWLGSSLRAPSSSSSDADQPAGGSKTRPQSPGSPQNRWRRVAEEMRRKQ